ncbi:hypothetical protein Q8F55_003458 [Vanrija albida]|uniref:PhoD-like phosphatase domain-containing protein n=1 Tax=Vanrija albida TaxID=181172 RepID=A0ABR3Q498_9TREE
MGKDSDDTNSLDARVRRVRVSGLKDTAGVHAAHRAEHLARQAAREARASYYAHPLLHLHTYVGEESHSDTDTDSSSEHEHNLPPLVSPAAAPLNAPFSAEAPVPVAGSSTGVEAEGPPVPPKTADALLNKLPPATKDEEDQPTTAVFPRPGPTADDIEAARKAPKAATGPNGASGEDEPHWSTTAVMQPHLQLMCGPLLSYYTILDGVWYGAALVVTADNGSQFEPTPWLHLRFNQYAGIDQTGPEALPPKTIPSQRIYTYNDLKQGPCSFWRFMLQIPLQHTETAVRYSLNRGAELEFVVPAVGQNLRWTAHSCNGFSSGVNPDDFKGEWDSGYDPLWEDMLEKHHLQPYHCMVGGGDQIYCDALTFEPEMQSWITAPDRKSKLNHPVTDDFKAALDRFFFNHYALHFRRGAFGRANSTIPMVNMLDDHDVIDGFGTYDDETMASPLFSYIGNRGYFWFLLFQLFTVDEIDGIDHPYPTHPVKSMVIGAHGPWIPFHNHSLSVYLGPKVHMFAIDCRSERKLHQVVSPETYGIIFDLIGRLPPDVEQLVIQLGVPIAYPRMSFLEHFLGAKYNPVNILARHNALGLGGMVNKFNQASELLDDLNDHWCANVHKKERNWLVLELQRVAQSQKLRVTFLSGDVHLAAVGCLYTHKAKLAPEADHRYMLNIVSSAIVNTPPPAGAAAMVAKLSGHKHRTLHKQRTDEMMLPIFDKDTDGKKQRKPYVLPRRNYTAIQYLDTGDLLFDLRVEKFKGAGDTVSYPVKAPPPRWEARTGTSVGAPSGAPSIQNGVPN